MMISDHLRNVCQNRKENLMSNTLRNAIPDMATFIYNNLGQHSVIDFAAMLEDNGHFSFDWAECEPCECNSPHFDNACLVCGSEKG